MAWIESHQDLGQHPKTFALAEELKIDVVKAVGVLHLLWHFTLKFAWATGDISKYSARVIAQSIYWEKDPLTLIKALQKTGWLDGMIVHDWQEFTLHYNLSMERQERQKSQVRERVKRWRNSNVTPEKALHDRNVTQCNAATVPDLTLPNHKKKEEKRKHSPHFSKPTPEEVTAYAKSIGFDLDGQHFWDHYEANGWRVGRNPMRDWRAAVRTWRRSEFRMEGKNGAHERKSIFGLPDKKSGTNGYPRNDSSLRKVPSAGEILAGVGNLPVPAQDRIEK